MNKSIPITRHTFGATGTYTYRYQAEYLTAPIFNSTRNIIKTSISVPIRLTLVMKQKSKGSSPASSVIYLKHTKLEDMLKVILLAAESPLGIAVMLYHIKYNDKNILFTASGALGTVVRYHVLDKELTKKWIELKRLTGDYTFVDKIGEDTKSLYIPVLELEKSTFAFPL